MTVPRVGVLVGLVLLAGADLGGYRVPHCRAVEAAAPSQILVSPLGGPVNRYLVMAIGFAGASPCVSSVATQAPPPPLPALRATGPLADSLRALAVEMVRRLRALDAPRVIALYGDTVHFVHVDEGTVIPWSALAQSMRTYFATATSNPLAIVGEPGVTLIDANNAVLYVTHRFEGMGDHPAHDGVWTGVVHRFRDGWKIVHSHSSDRKPETRTGSP